MSDIQYLKFELEGIKQTVGAAFSAHNDAINDIVIEQLDKKLNQAWVNDAIGHQVEEAIRIAIADLANHRELQRALRDALNEKITGMVRGE